MSNRNIVFDMKCIRADPQAGICDTSQPSGNFLSSVSVDTASPLGVQVNAGAVGGPFLTFGSGSGTLPTYVINPPNVVNLSLAAQNIIQINSPGMYEFSCTMTVELTVTNGAPNTFEFKFGVNGVAFPTNYMSSVTFGAVVGEIIIFSFGPVAALLNTGDTLQLFVRRSAGLAGPVNITLTDGQFSIDRL